MRSWAPPLEGPARTFALTRESVYRALESGLGVDEIAYLLDADTSEVRGEIVRGLGDLQTALAARITKTA